MNRVERLKEVKHRKRKVLFAVLFFLSLVITGICTVDYSFNSLMNNKNSIQFVSIKSLEGSYVELKFMNQSFYINTKYLERDLKGIKDKISNLF